MFLIDTLILVASVLLLLGIASSKLSARLGMPVLVLFLVVGMLAGSEGIGGLEFENYQLAHGIGTLALAMILFDGGLGTSLAAIRLSWKPSILLATVGVLVTAVITGLAASWILEISLLEGLLLGSIVGSTDASAVFSTLRWGGVGLPKRIAAVLEVESASNDPMAIFLTIGCIEVLLGNLEIGPGLLGLFASQMLIGGVFGLLGGYAAVEVVNRIELGAAGLYPVLISGCSLLVFGLAAQVGGSGFLAVYLAGVVIGNRRLMFQRSILRFHDAIAWLSQIIMFVTLGLLCFPSRLWDASGNALLISVVLLFVARPVAAIRPPTVGATPRSPLPQCVPPCSPLCRKLRLAQVAPIGTRQVRRIRKVESPPKVFLKEIRALRAAFCLLEPRTKLARGNQTNPPWRPVIDPVASKVQSQRLRSVGAGRRTRQCPRRCHGRADELTATHGRFHGSIRATAAVAAGCPTPVWSSGHPRRSASRTCPPG